MMSNQKLVNELLENLKNVQYIYLLEIIFVVKT